MSLPGREVLLQHTDDEWLPVELTHGVAFLCSAVLTLAKGGDRSSHGVQPISFICKLFLVFQGDIKDIQVAQHRAHNADSFSRVELYIQELALDLYRRDRSLSEFSLFNATI